MAETIVDDELWEDFHSAVNMTSAELRDWLSIEDAHEETEELPDPLKPPPDERTV